jgi:hypothetical protein
MPSQTISSQYSTTGTSDSIASSYRPPDQRKVPLQLRPMLAQSSNQAKYPYESDNHVSDELIHHPTIVKLQQQNFHRLLSSAESSTSSSSVIKQHQQAPMHSGRDDDQGTYVSSTTTTTNDQIHSVKPASDNQRAVLHQRKQALMKAIQSINKQMEELDMQ